MNYYERYFEAYSACARVSTIHPCDGVGEHNIMISCTNPRLPYSEQLSNLLKALEEVQSELPADAAPVFKRYFLSDASNQAHKLPKDACAVSIVEQPPLNGTKVALWAYYQDGMKVEKLPNGLSRAAHGAYEHFWRGSMCAPDLSSEVATIAMLGDYSTTLSNMGCTLADNCMRTWLFVHDVDVNYRGVVYGRNEVFRCAGLTPDTHFIASTGIGGRNPDPRVTVELDTYAVKGIKREQVKYLQAPTHLNPTYEYGVAFERGTSIDYGDRRHVLISGTASINNSGEVMYVGNIVKQTGRMIENVEALLSAAECSWDDVTHIIVYLRDTADYAVVSDIIAERFPKMPFVIVLAPVCRSGWLIEMECMAIKESRNPHFPPL